MQKDYIVFSQKLAGTLMAKGFKLVKFKKTNKPDSNRNVFIFNESSELLQTIEDYKNNK